MLDRIKDIATTLILGFIHLITILTIVIMVGGTVVFIVIAVAKTF